MMKDYSDDVVNTFKDDFIDKVAPRIYAQGIRKVAYAAGVAPSTVEKAISTGQGSLRLFITLAIVAGAEVDISLYVPGEAFEREDTEVE